MARTSKGGMAVRKHGNPKPGANRRIASPNSGSDAAQMIADDIESEVLSYISRMTMERALMRMDMRTVLGVGGPDLEQYEDLLKEGFTSATEEKPEAPYGMDREDSPSLNQISSEIELKATLANGGADPTAEPDPKTKRRRKGKGDKK